MHETMPEALAYALTCTVYRDHPRLLAVSPVVKDMTPANIHHVPAVPLHPGTERYLQNPQAACTSPVAVTAQ